MSYAVETLNNIRVNASTEYQNRIPQATRDNIATIGQAFQQYTLLYNEFCSALMNQIGKTILEQKMFTNKLARFKTGALTDQKDVQEIFVEMAKAECAFDKDGKNPLGRRTGPEIMAAYHRMNRQDQYAITIGDLDFLRVFQSEATLEAFISSRLNAVYSGDAYDEWLAMKNVLATFEYQKESGTGTYFNYEITNGTGDAFAKRFVKTLRKAVSDVSFMSNQYNAAGVNTWTDPQDLVLLVNKDVVAEVDVELLAHAFHSSNTDMKSAVGQIVVMDDFGSMTDAFGLLIDKDFFKVWDTLSHMEQQRNAQGLFTNHFYHHHQILSASPFKTAVKLKIV